MKVIALFFLVMMLFGASLFLFQQFYYTFLVSVYHLLIKLFSPFHKKAGLWVKGRKYLFKNLAQHFPDNTKKTIWFHCASLGEFEQGRPVMEALKKNNPEIKILLTFYSPSGYEVQKNYIYADYVTYFPADTKKNAEKFVTLVKPDLAVFVKYEFWIHHINALQKNGVPLYLISGIFRKNQLFFKWYVSLFRTALKKYTFLYVQNSESLRLLQSIKIQNVAISFDTRFDRVKTISDNRKIFPEIAEFVKNHNVIVAGSTWPKDERVIAKAFYKSLVYVNFKLIIVAHEIGKPAISNTQKKFKKYSILYSRLNEFNIEDLHGKRVMIIDNIGMLSSLYQYGDIHYIGGGFNQGIHNCLEAAVYGKPILIGPKYKKFNEAVDLLASNAAFEIRDYNEMLNRINLMNQFQFIYTGAGKDAKNYVTTHLGGTKTIVEALERKLNLQIAELIQI